MQDFKMEIKLSNRFKKDSRKTNDKIRKFLTQRLKLFEQNPRHPLLRNHSLSGKYKNYRSINITGDWRALYSEHREKGKINVIFELLGKHSQIYR